MLDMDIDAFFEEQDARMNISDDDMDEFLARKAQARYYPPNLYDFSLQIPQDNSPSNSLPDQSHGVPPNNLISLQIPQDNSSSSQPRDVSANSSIRRSPRTKRKEPTSESIELQGPKRSKHVHGEVEEPPVSPIFVETSCPKRTPTPRRVPDNSEPPSKQKPSPTKSDPPPRKKAAIGPPSSPIPPQPEIILKRKHSPSKPAQPARKKAAIDPTISPSSPVQDSPAPLSKKEKPPSKTLPPVKKPPSKRVKPSVRPSVKIPQSPVPVPIDLVSPIEEPDFSVLVSRFEPEATSTQPKLGAEPSAFLQLKERVEKKAMMKREKKIAKASKTGAIVAGPSKAAISGDESIISVSSSSSLPPSPEPNRIVPVKVKQKQKQKQKAAPAEPPKSVKAPPKQKGKTAERVRMYPKDYAQMLKDKSDSSLKPTGKPQFLKGKYIFYTGGDMTWASKSTMKCMDIIVQYGGNICPVFDGSIVTHIVTDASPTTTLRALGVKKTAEIPDHIPVLTWSWVTDSIDDGRPAELFHYAAFSNRIPPASYLANSSKGKGKQRAVAGDESRISAFTQDKKERRRTIHDSEDEDSDADVKPGPGPLASPPPSPKHKARATDASSFRTKSGGKADPLAEFYAQAKVDRDNAWSRPGEVDEQDETDVEDAGEAAGSDSDEESTRNTNPGPAPKRGFTCDNKEVQRKNGPNEFIVKKLEQLMNLHKAKPGMDDHWRAFSYQKCLRSIRNHPKRIKSFNEARSIRGVGNKTALKIMEIVETGDLRRIGYENTADVQVRAIFQGIYGVGQTTAYKWYAAGCRSIKNLVDGTGGVVLTPAQKIGIQFYDDINDRMPREEAKALFELIKPVALAIDPKLEVQIMGSYRRGKADCGDIDIMITRCPDDGKTHAGILHHLLKALHERKIITEDLALPEDPFDEEAIYRGLCHLPHFGARRRRIDFLCIPWKSRGAALLYYTGDDIFNRAMRYKAGALGYSLNQKGLSAGVVRDPNNRTKKLSAGNVVASETEEEIFRMLDVPFQEPHERVRG